MQNDKHRGSLGSKFENFGAAPSEGLWDSIADNLDGKKKRRGIIWWFTGVGIAAVGILAVLIYNGQPVTNQQSGTINEIKESEMTVPADLFTQETPKENKESLPDRFGHRVQDESPINTERIQDNNENNQAVNNSNVPENNEQNMANQAPNHVEEGTDLADVMEEKVDLNKMPLLGVFKIDALQADWGEELSTLSPIEKPKKRKNKWELGVEVGSWRTLSGPTKSQADVLLLNDTDEEMIDTATLGLSEDASITSNPKVEVGRPIEVRFHIGYRIRERWRITSGITFASNRYSYVESQFASVTAFAELPFYPGPARISSVSIPVNVEFDFIKRNRFRMGAGLGVLNEIPVWERYQPYYDANYTGKKGFNTNFISGYNFAVNTQLSASYYLTEFMRIRGTLGTRIYTREKVNSSLNIPSENFWGGGSLGVVWELH